MGALPAGQLVLTGGSYSLRSRTLRTEWSSPLTMMRLARWRVGRTFSTKFGPLMVCQIVNAVASASESDSVEYRWK